MQDNSHKLPSRLDRKGVHRRRSKVSKRRQVNSGGKARSATVWYGLWVAGLILVVGIAVDVYVTRFFSDVWQLGYVGGVIAGVLTFTLVLWLLARRGQVLKQSPDRVTSHTRGKSPPVLSGLVVGLWVMGVVLLIALVAVIEFTWWLDEHPWTSYAAIGAGGLLVMGSIVWLVRRRSSLRDDAQWVQADGEHQDGDDDFEYETDDNEEETVDRSTVSVQDPVPVSHLVESVEDEDEDADEDFQHQHTATADPDIKQQPAPVKDRSVAQDGAQKADGDGDEPEVPLTFNKHKLDELRQVILDAFPELRQERDSEWTGEG